MNSTARQTLFLQYTSLGESPPLSHGHSRYSRPSRRGNEGKKEDYNEREDETVHRWVKRDHNRVSSRDRVHSQQKLPISYSSIYVLHILQVTANLAV